LFCTSFSSIILPPIIYITRFNDFYCVSPVYLIYLDALQFYSNKKQEEGGGGGEKPLQKVVSYYFNQAP